MRRSLLLCILLAPLAAAGTESAPDVEDVAGDSGTLPCSPATDIRKFWAVWGDDALEFHYVFEDLSVLEQAAAQDATGSCFYSYADVVIEVGNTTLTDSVYMDYNSNPQFATGWRFYFHESRDDLEGTVTIADNHIQVDAPYALIGMPSPGDRAGDFRIQATNNIEGQGLAYQGDWAPETGPCGCWVEFGIAPGDGGADGNGTTGDGTGDDTGGNGTTEPGQDSPLPVALTLLAILIARRR